MGFDSLKGAAKERPSGSSRNIAGEVIAFEGESVRVRDLENGSETTITLSAERTYPRRPPLSIYATGGQLEGDATIRKVEAGGIMVFLQCYEKDGAYEAKEARTVKAGAADKVTVLVDVMARVDKPFQRRSTSKWAQNVVILDDRGAVKVTDAASVNAAGLDALVASLPGRKGFVLRGVSGKEAVAVRFMQPFRQEGDTHVPVSGGEAWEAFLAQEMTVSGLRGENGGFVTLTGTQIVDRISAADSWEVVPCMVASFGSKTVEDNKKGNREPSRQWRFDFDDERSGTGFRPAIVALGLGNEGQSFVNFVATTQSYEPVPMAYVPTNVAAPDLPELGGAGEASGSQQRQGGGSGWEPPQDLDDDIPFVRLDDGGDLLLGKRTTWRLS